MPDEPSPIWHWSIPDRNLKAAVQQQQQHQQCSVTSETVASQHHTTAPSLTARDSESLQTISLYRSKFRSFFFSSNPSLLYLSYLYLYFAMFYILPHNQHYNVNITSIDRWMIVFMIRPHQKQKKYTQCAAGFLTAASVDITYHRDPKQFISNRPNFYAP